MSNILICGSMAYDSIMVFNDYFKNHILPDQIHKLSVAFYVPELKRNFGGTAGNIAYNLSFVFSVLSSFILSNLVLILLSIISIVLYSSNNLNTLPNNLNHLISRVPIYEKVYKNFSNFIFL